MNIKNVSVKKYFSLSEEEKVKFYRSILDDTPKSKITTQYRTALNTAPQARVPLINFHQEHGKLTFITPLKRTDRNITGLFFLCVCDCGEWMILEANAFRKEKQIQCFKCSLKHQSEKIFKDISGEIFGQLKALYPTEKRGKDGSIYWMCECIDCGHKQIVIKYNLNKNGHLCEICNTRSLGEYKIAKLLEDNNISFEKEKVFDDCRFLDSGAVARFDFYVNNQYIIEIDGEQHYQPTRFSKNISKEKAYQLFIKRQEKDNFKNNYCFKNNIPIIRIPYFNLRDITIKDLDPINSKFLLTEEGRTTEIDI